jgi:hypothetical protein
MPLSPRTTYTYHVFLASPGDVGDERQHVRQFFERYNRHHARQWNVRFEVIDWENNSSIGVGRPQELITQQTLKKYKDSLALVVGIMNQRFGTQTGIAESGTEEEFDTALAWHRENDGWPEIKWYFRTVEELKLSADREKRNAALEQWDKVEAFRHRMQDLDNPVFYTEYPGTDGFRDVLENDLNVWLADESRPWVVERPVSVKRPTSSMSPPTKYYENVDRDFRRLDIAGIDNDRTFEIPLSEIYVRLRVMFDEDATEETEEYDSGAIDIQTALLQYNKLVIVGDPGSGKSTFLKYIALMLARSVLQDDPGIAREKLCLEEPLPVPIFLSCWDLADFLKHREEVRVVALLEFIADRLTASEFSITAEDVEKLLASGGCCLLFDGLDEVPSDAGRAAVSRMLEDCIDRYGDNRFVVTSRIRAYTGDAILKGQFTRCDIQPFDANDRAEFIRNWVALLFRVSPGDVETAGTDAAREFTSLANGVEASDRIRPLAVNPLLLTVIAIVHWNRRRLPEQRVDLYDECIDVLLGQRKEAEHIQIGRKTDMLDDAREEQTHEERAWVRKRFAEIALQILSLDGEDDEASKAQVIKLLVPRFLDQGAANAEQAAARAERFLERQELRSGLLVSRRAHSYRFVHLTFQEYLAAWQLSNMDFDTVTAVIQPGLRLAKWFETLQLLGAQWAIGSDDKADRYIAWLLSERGTTITDQAPVVALCSNIVKDISGVTELQMETRKSFSEAVEATLDAFRKRSGVPQNTQLEILEALGQLGAAVKSHLIDATKAGAFQVRRRAIQMLLPHLSDDELFGMTHLVKDQSQEPIRTYLRALLERNRTRAIKFLSGLSTVWKMAEGTLTVSEGCLSDDDALSRTLLAIRAVNQNYYSRRIALETLAEKWPDETTRELLAQRAAQDDNVDIRVAALKFLIKKWSDETTHKLIAQWAVQDDSFSVRSTALEALAEKWPDETTRELLAVQDDNAYARTAALEALAEKWPDETTRELLAQRAAQDDNAYARTAALEALAEKWPDETTRELLAQRATQDDREYPRRAALRALAETWPDETTRELLTQRAVQDDDNWVRSEADHLAAELAKRLEDSGRGSG